MAGSNNEQSVDVAALIEDDRNRTKVVCQLCSSVILLPGKAAYVSKEVNIEYCTPPIIHHDVIVIMTDVFYTYHFFPVTP